MLTSNLADRPQLLVTVLDWGMGHATRTLPLAEHAIELGWHVHIASKGTALAWLRAHLSTGHVTFHTKPGPEITYSKRGNFFRIAGQLPSFLVFVEKERRWTQNLVSAQGIHAVFSDNCYGCVVAGTPSVLMSHQLQIPVPRALKSPARSVVARWAREFDELWVPDLEPGPGSLSGMLAAADVHPCTKHVGVLSRLAPYRRSDTAPTWARVGMVSGVEPHRALMEQALRDWMQGTDEPCLIVAGKPGGGVKVEGEVIFQGQDIFKMSNSEFREVRRRLQIIFQDPYSSLNPRMTVGDMISEPMEVHKLYKTKRE
ncbi:MAG: hypothetical protein ACPG6N_06730, partial [Flavobacteriales bacterium]